MTEKKLRCASVAEWLERTGTNQTMLRERLEDEEHRRVSAGHISDVVKGSRRCSLDLALALHRLTGVPVEKIAAWPRLRPRRVLRPHARKPAA